MTETTESKPQRILAGRYEIGAFIGQGGMATVYRGVDTKLGRQVAIKIMRANLAGDEAFRSRFRQEALSASRLAHPSVVRVLDAGDDLIQTADGPQRLPFIVMEYIDGHNLRELVAKERLSSTEACRVVEAVLTALEYSHRAGIVHRDIKPANIMITRSGQVKVMDFGIARAISETSSTVQQTTAILGTAAYFSPEQAKGEAVDARTDLYSTGVLLYELLTGDVPFRGDTAVAVAYQHVSERPTPPSERDPAVTPELDRVILHALGKDRARRFQTAAEFRQALQLARNGTMPPLDRHDEDAPVLFSDGEEVSPSDFAIRRLAEGGVARSQSRPPVLWVWAAILTVIAVVVGVVVWLAALAPTSFTPTSSRVIPDLVGVERGEAVDALLELGLVPIAVEESNEEIPANTVIRTDPAGGEVVTPATSVRVYISTGPESPEVPAIDRMNLAEYTEALEAVGLSVGMVTRSDDPNQPADRVLSVSPEPGSPIARGRSVDLVVSSGLVTVPDVIGQSIQAATAMLEAQRLATTVTPNPGCPQQPGVPVISQSLIGQQPQGSIVEIGYCSG